MRRQKQQANDREALSSPGHNWINERGWNDDSGLDQKSGWSKECERRRTSSEECSDKKESETKRTIASRVPELSSRMRKSRDIISSSFFHLLHE